MFVPTSRKFFDEFTGSGGSGVTYLNALQGDKITCEIEGYFYWAMENQHYTAVSGDKTITLFEGNTFSFITQGFKEGDTFDIVGSPTNDGSYTIASVTDKVITTVEAINSEDIPSASLYGTTLITAIDLLYDLIPNNSTKSDFVSATDKGTLQRYSADGLDASVTTPVFMQVATDSYGWVTDVLSGDDTEAFIEGVSITDYKQYFKITHVFYMTRIWTKELIQNFANRIAPEEYLKDNHLKHICRIDGKFDYYSPIVDHTGSIVNQKGQTGWFNQSNSQTKAEYSIGSITYQNDVTSDFINQIDATIVNKVTMIINSRSGKFVASTSKFILNHILCPLSESVLVNTSTTLLENIRLDKKILTSDASAVNGINYGTDYQALKDIEVVNFSANQVTITFKVDYSSATKEILKNRNSDDRYYAFWVSCQDIAITTTKNVDRVNALADFKLADYDTRDTTLWGLLDYIHCFSFPNYGVFETKNINGYEGDPAYVEIPFWVETAAVDGVTPTLQTATIQIVSTKTGNDDFILEEKSFDVATVRKLNDKQTIDQSQERGFIFVEDSPWNRCNIIRYEAGDSGTKIAYKIQYAFALRYESWLEVIQSADGYTIDIFKDVEEVVEAWKRYSTGNGWDLRFRLNAEVVGYDGSVTPFTTYTTFNILAEGDAPDDGVQFTAKYKYYNEAGKEVDALLLEEKTRIVARFGGDPTIFPTDMTVFNGYFYESDELGSVFTRRIASTDFDSESDSPFSTEDLPTLNGVISDFQSANARLSVFSNRVEIDTWYTPSSILSAEQKIIGARLGYQQANILLQEDGSALLQESGSYILLE